MKRDVKKTRGYPVFIEGWLLVHTGLRPGAKLLFGVLKILAKKKGFAWATTRYLAQATATSTRGVEKWLQQLRDMGLIGIETKGRRRKIFIAEQKLH